MDRDIPEGLGEKFDRLAGIMARLRSPGGCPWDLEQTPETLARHMLEEAYESVEAIESEDWGHLREELGDLLLQVVFQSRIAQEHGRFDLGEVVDGISGKLERRHPHIFGAVEAGTAEQVSINWDRIKREEKGGGGRRGGVRTPRGIPALLAALTVQGQAARAGFDWPGAREVLPKLDEELEELKSAVMDGAGDPRDEIGDLLFTVVNLARHLGVEPEQALRSTCCEFERRFALMEAGAALEGREFASLSMEEKERLWLESKAPEKTGGDDEHDL